MRKTIIHIIQKYYMTNWVEIFLPAINQCQLLVVNTEESFYQCQLCKHKSLHYNEVLHRKLYIIQEYFIVWPSAPVTSTYVQWLICAPSQGEGEGGGELEIATFNTVYRIQLPIFE